MSHADILTALTTLINAAGDNLPAGSYGYMRVLETLIEYAEHSPDPTIRSTVCNLDRTLNAVAYAGPFLAIDSRDTRPSDQLFTTVPPSFDRGCA